MLWKGLKGEILKLSGAQKIFILCAMICSFCITSDYGIVRPVSHSMVLSTYGSQMFPYIWLAVIPLNLLVVELYNRFLARLGVLRMFFTIVITVLAVNAFCAIFMSKFSFLPFFFYIWKEIYVMLLFQQLWSVVHSTMHMSQAKYIYGILFAVGGVGGICGSSWPSLFAVSLGSPNLIFASIPILLILTGAFFFLFKNSSVSPQESQPQKQINNFWQGVDAIRKSKYLTFILLIVVLMQVVTTLIYHQFNITLESSVATQDLRTEYCGKVMVIANTLTFTLQLFGSIVLVHFLGLKKSHLLLPLVLCLNAIGSLFMPTFAMISFAYITIKAFDFSLFQILKEMLYIPLKQEEKFKAKSIIDVFAYRSAKGLASCLILVLQSLSLMDFIHSLTIGSLVLLLLWTAIVYKMFQLKTEKAEAAETETGVSQ